MFRSVLYGWYAHPWLGWIHRMMSPFWRSWFEAWPGYLDLLVLVFHEVDIAKR